MDCAQSISADVRAVCAAVEEVAITLSELEVHAADGDLADVAYMARSAREELGRARVFLANAIAALALRGVSVAECGVIEREEEADDGKRD